MKKSILLATLVAVTIQSQAQQTLISPINGIGTSQVAIGQQQTLIPAIVQTPVAGIAAVQTPVAGAAAVQTVNGLQQIVIPQMPGTTGMSLSTNYRASACTPSFLQQMSLQPAPQSYSIPQYQAWEQNQSFYGQIWARCMNEITQLTQDRMQAQRILRRNGHHAAADFLIRALERVYVNVNVEIGERLPHTYQAVIASYYLAKSVESAVNAQQLDVFLKGRIKYNAVNKAIDAIVYAYNQLDNPFYMTRVNTCAGGLGVCNNIPLPETYYTNLTSLAGQYINLFLSMAVDGSAVGNWASDTVELAVGKVVAQLGRTLINSSDNRRYLACVAYELYQIEILIDEVLSSCSPQYLVAQDVEMIRARFVNVGRFMSQTHGVPTSMCHVRGW